MPTVLIHADTLRSPDLRHAVPLAVPDPFLYVEQDGRRTAVVSPLEAKRIAAVGIDVIPFEELGLDELLASGMDSDAAELVLCERACERLGVTSAAVPPSFPLELADRLRSAGVELRVDRKLFETRRRSKNEAELAGLRRAQRATEAALDAARALLRAADASGDVLLLEGEPLTCERLKVEVARVLSEHAVAAEEFIVSHGAQTAIGHEFGSGPIAPGEPIVFDVFPRDRESGVYTDMTRAYVVGEPPEEIARYHRLCLEALRRATEAVRPGANGKDLHRLVCDRFAAEGFPTQLTRRPGELLESGFFHSLGHGVGLEVHERPALGRSGDELVPGDVIALEPGLYRAGYGGVRLEDVVVVTADGAEVVTDYPYELAP